LLSGVSARPIALSGLTRGHAGQISGFRMSEAERAWLGALGLPIGESVMILRQAPFGGPLHVRAGSGAEFALDLHCASNIDVVLCAVAVTPRP
jgi:Fe2+ transport system protein FeoA